MARPPITLLIAVVILCRSCMCRAEPLGDYVIGNIVPNLLLPSPRYDNPSIFEEFQRAKEDRRLTELIKKFPPEDPLKARLSLCMAIISSTNFTADINKTPMVNVHGLSAGD